MGLVGQEKPSSSSRPGFHSAFRSRTFRLLRASLVQGLFRLLRCAAMLDLLKVQLPESLGLDPNEPQETDSTRFATRQCSRRN